MATWLMDTACMELCNKGTNRAISGEKYRVEFGVLYRAELDSLVQCTKGKDRVICRANYKMKPSVMFRA